MTSQSSKKLGFGQGGCMGLVCHIEKKGRKRIQMNVGLYVEKQRDSPEPPLIRGKLELGCVRSWRNVTRRYV